MNVRLRRREQADVEIRRERGTAGVAERQHLLRHQVADQVGSGREFIFDEASVIGHVAEPAVGGPQLLSFAKQRGAPVRAGAVIRLARLKEPTY